MFIRKNSDGCISNAKFREICCYYNGGESIVKHGIAFKGKQIYCGKGYGK